jgi:hypothetical protein
LSVLAHDKQKVCLKKPCEVDELRHCQLQALELHGGRGFSFRRGRGIGNLLFLPEGLMEMT